MKENDIASGYERDIEMDYLIEDARRRNLEKEAREAATRNIFEDAISILSKHGKEERKLKVLKYKVFKGEIEPQSDFPIPILIFAGANLERADSVHVRLIPLDYYVNVKKVKKGKSMSYEGIKFYPLGNSEEFLDLKIAESYSSVLADLKNNLPFKPKTSTR